MRAYVELLYVPEPLPGADGRRHGSVAPERRLAVRYPDGPRDAESLAVDPAENRIYLLSKRDAVPRLYSLPAWPPRGVDTVTVRFETEVPVLAEAAGDPANAASRWAGQPTDMAFHPAGRGAAVLTYTAVYWFPRRTGRNWADTFAGEAERIAIPPMPQAEALAFTADGRGVLVTTEEAPAPIYVLTIPGDPD